MQKKIIALAVAGLMSGAAFAQSNVTISGLFDAGVNWTKIEGSTQSMNAGYNNTGTSNLTFAATEDLGGGMKAGVLAETDLRGGGTLANFQHYVWMGANWGTLSLGQRTNFTTTTAVTIQPFGTAHGGGYATTFTRLRGGGFGAGGTFSAAITAAQPNVPGAGTDMRDVRPNGVVDYRSPSMSGFTVGLQYRPRNSDATETAASAGQTNLGLNYNNGPMNLSYAYSNITNTTALAGGGNYVRHDLLGGNYSFGPATVYLGWTRSKTDAGAAVTADSRSWNIGLKYDVTSKIAIKANILRDDDKSVANVDSTLNAIGADYAFSKRTAAYVVWTGGDYNKAAATGKYDLFSVGMRHSF